MAENTPNLGLYKKNPLTDGNDTFNIQSMLNDNWDKIDEHVATKEDLKNIDLTSIENQIQEVDKNLTSHKNEDASLTSKGHVQLSSAIDSESETLAATPKAVKIINQAVNEINEKVNNNEKYNNFMPINHYIPLSKDQITGEKQYFSITGAGFIQALKLLLIDNSGTSWNQPIVETLTILIDGKSIEYKINLTPTSAATSPVNIYFYDHRKPSLFLEGIVGNINNKLSQSLPIDLIQSSVKDLPRTEEINSNSKLIKETIFQDMSFEHSFEIKRTSNNREMNLGLALTGGII